MTKDSKEAKEGLERQNWLDQFLQCKIWKMAEGEEGEEGEGDKSRIKSASSQGWQALKKNYGRNFFSLQGTPQKTQLPPGPLQIRKF